MSARIPDHHQAAGALHHEIPLLRFVNETVFQTKAGSFGMVLQASGIDPECRLDEDLESYARRIEKALKTFDERFRVYQYMIKRFGSEIPSKGEYPNQRAGEFVSRRVRDLGKRHQTLASISLFLVVLYEGDPTAHRLAEWFGVSGARARRQLAENDIRAIEALTGAVRAFTSSLDDMLGFEVLEESRAKIFFRSLLNPDAEHVEHFHSEPGDRLDYALADTSIRVEHDHLRLDDYYLTAATVKLTPANPKPAAIASALARVNCDFIACMEWKTQSTVRMRKLIKSRQKTFVAQGVSMFMAAFAGAWTPKSEMPRKQDLEHHAENLGDCLVALEEGNQFGAFSCVVVLLGKDHHRVRNSFAELVRVYGQADASLVRETLNLTSAYLSILPGNTQRNHSYSYLLSRDYANLTFAWQSWTGNAVNKHLRDEYMCLYETRDQQLFFFNGHVGGTFGVLKTGAPESGKSFDTVYQIANLQKYDPVTLVLDIGGSYRDLTELLRRALFRDLQAKSSRAHESVLAREHT